MTDTDDALRARLLGPLSMHFAAARSAYRDYLDGGRIFLFALALRRINLAARALLMNEGWRLPEALRSEALALVRHYDGWMAQWEDLRRRADPGLQDAFVFETRIPYPKEAETRLLALLEA